MKNDKPLDATTDDIAIVGMACLFPGAPSLEAYWRNILGKVDSTTDPPPEAWDVDTFYDPETQANDRVYCKRGGFIAPIAEFDPLDNGVMPRTVEGGEPDQWLALRVAREALADAGYTNEIPERRNTAVILGKGTYLNRGNLSVVQHGRMIDQTMSILRTMNPELSGSALEEIRAELKRKLPPFSADTAPGLIPNIIAGRIANRLDLMGPNYTVDAACASSLIAVDHAMRGLRNREYDLALAGGVHVATPVPTLMLFCQLGALSRREEIRPFDALADGTVLGGGLGMVVLKRLADAKRDGNRIYATVKSVGVSSDGRGLAVMAPRPEGEELALRRAYEAAGIDPRSVGLIEAHGTGTPVGDATEVGALTSVFGAPNGDLPWCGLGSVKSNIGHAMPAAGIAGLIKVALSLHHRVLPPTIHVDEPNPKLGLERSPFYLNTEARPWIHGGELPRRAGVNAFGFGGINAHAILEEAPSGAPNDWMMPRSSEVVILAGSSKEEVRRKAAELLERLQTMRDASLADVAWSLSASPPEGSSRLAIVASDLGDLREKLGEARKSLEDPKRSRIREVRGIYFESERAEPGAKLAFVFPGEGSQYLGMLSELCMHFPDVRARFDLVDRVFRGHRRRFVPSDFLYPRPVFSDEERREAEARLWQMEGAFESVLTADWAIYELLLKLGIRPDAMLGHSTGEYAAMRASGMMPVESDDDVARFARELNELYYRQGAKEGIASSALVAIGASSEAVREALGSDDGELFIAMENCPHQTVVVGSGANVDRFLARVASKGWIYERLSFDRPYHTPLFEAFSEGLRGFLTEWLTSAPKTSLYSCTSGGRFPDELGRCQELAWRHWMSPVRFRETIEEMYEDGVRIFVEVGPRGNLSAFVDDTLRGRPHLAVPADSASRPGITQLNHLVGLLWVNGVSLELDELYRGRRLRRVELGEPPGTKARRPMKLEIGWIPMELSSETATRLRATHRPEPVPEDKDKDKDKHEHEGRSPSTPWSTTTAASAPPLNGAAKHHVEPPPIPAPPVPSQEVPGDVMATYWKTMDQFLSVQQEIMEGYLQGRSARPAEVVPKAPPLATEPAAATAPKTAIEPEPRPSTEPEPPVESASAGDPAPAAAGDVRELLLGIVSERTGYPVEMIGLDLDLEADLGIDSIKRVEILGSLQQQTQLLGENDMEALSGRRTLGEVLQFLEGAGRSEVEPAEPAGEAPPFLRSIERHVRGEELAARCVLDLSEDLFLGDHALGHGVSRTNPALRGLPVVPMTMGMEILAEAALAMAAEPSMTVIGMRDVRAQRWMMLDGDERLELRVVAKRDPSRADAARARLFLAGSDVPVVEGTVLLGSRYPDAPEARELALSKEAPSRLAADELYGEVMFHGPLFQGVAGMERSGEDGATARLRALSPDGLFASTSRPALATDPVLLDQPGQVVGFWTAERLERGHVVFPYQLDALALYSAPGAASGELECRARIRLVGDELVDSDLVVLDTAGRTVCAFTGWKDRRFDVPRPFLRFLHDPAGRMLSEPSPDGFVLRLDGFPQGFFTAHGGLWQRALALLVLGPNERRRWRELELELELDPGERLSWLLRRLAAKDAARSFLQEREGIVLTPADIELPPENGDRSQFSIPLGGGREARISVALSTAGDTISAVAGPADASGELERDIVRSRQRDEQAQGERTE